MSKAKGYNIVGNTSTRVDYTPTEQRHSALKEIGRSCLFELVLLLLFVILILSTYVPGGGLQ